VPGVPGSGKQIGIASVGKERLPPESRCWAGCIARVMEPLSRIFFLFSAGRVLAEKCWFGMELVFHATEHGIQQWAQH